MSVLVISELGINHGGSEELCYDMIDSAQRCGADAVKFQLYNPANLVPPQQPLSKKDAEKFEMLSKLLLPRDAYIRIYDYCVEYGIKFACTPFDVECLDFLLDNTDMAFVKIASPSVHDFSLLKMAASSGLPVIISTGMCDMTEISKVDKLMGAADVTYLHCVSLYPCPPEEADLSRMNDLRIFGRPIGISDHSGTIEIPLAAVELGAKVVECHFTMDREAEGPDHTSSLEPDQFKEMVRTIREKA